MDGKATYSRLTVKYQGLNADTVILCIVTLTSSSEQLNLATNGGPVAGTSAATLAFQATSQSTGRAPGVVPRAWRCICSLV